MGVNAVRTRILQAGFGGGSVGWGAFTREVGGFVRLSTVG